MDVAGAIAELVDRQVSALRRALIAIDGPDAAGKTTLADHVAARVRSPVIRSSIDGFHQPRPFRHRRGELSPEGYYNDSFDHVGMIAELLEPFAGGTTTVTTKMFDFRRDTPQLARVERVPVACALLFDGVFLLRPGVRDFWTLAVYLHVSEDVSVRRACARDVSLFGTTELVEKRYRCRYLPGQQLYRDDARPLETADIVIDNDDPERPQITKWSPRQA